MGGAKQCYGKKGLVGIHADTKLILLEDEGG